MSIISKLKGKFAYYQRNMSLFYWTAKREGEDSFKTPKAISFEIIKEITPLQSFSFSYNTGDYQNRFANNHLMAFFTKDNTIICYGWINPNGSHLLGELNLTMQFENPTDVLYDFVTLESFRGQGLYPTLLHNMCNRNSYPKLIYAFPDNKSSIKGILKASFKFIGNINGLNKNKYKSLITKYEQDNF